MEAEADEMWSYVGSKKQQQGLWHAFDPETGEGLASVLSSHHDSAFLELKAILEPFGIMQFYTDGWGAYVGVACRRHYAILIRRFYTVGKRNTQTQSFAPPKAYERKHLA